MVGPSLPGSINLDERNQRRPSFSKLAHGSPLYSDSEKNGFGLAAKHRSFESTFAPRLLMGKTKKETTLREQKSGPSAKKVDRESAVLANIAAMPGPDRIIGERLHAIIKA